VQEFNFVGRHSLSFGQGSRGMDEVKAELYDIENNKDKLR
jgi:hypothetical protein